MHCNEMGDKEAASAFPLKHIALGSQAHCQSSEHVEQKSPAVKVAQLSSPMPGCHHPVTPITDLDPVAVCIGVQMPLEANMRQSTLPGSASPSRAHEHVAIAGNARWLDKERRQCLVLWKKLEEWANTLYSFVRELGMQESVMTVDELSSGDEVAGTGTHLKCLATP